MIQCGIRRFATTALRAAEVASRADAANPYGVQLARAQGHVNGLVGGKLCLVSISHISHKLICSQQSATLLSSN